MLPRVPPSVLPLLSSSFSAGPWLPVKVNPSAPRPCPTRCASLVGREHHLPVFHKTKSKELSSVVVLGHVSNSKPTLGPEAWEDANWPPSHGLFLNLGVGAPSHQLIDLEEAVPQRNPGEELYEEEKWVLAQPSNRQLS